jgi:hypothetical protein
MVWRPRAKTPEIAPNPTHITKNIARINSGTARKKTVITLAIKKTIEDGMIFLDEAMPRGIERDIARKVPHIAISIVSTIVKRSSLTLDMSGGNILFPISKIYDHAPIIAS